MLTQFQKAVLGVLGGGLLVIALAVAARGGAATPYPSTIILPPQSDLPPGIVTTGEARLSVRPDIARLSIGAIAQAASAAEAQAQLSARITRVLERARALGIAERDISHGSYSIHPQYSYNERGDPPRLVGYQASQQIEITLRDVDRVGAVLDELVQNDGATTASVAFALTDPKAAQAQARTQAIAEARSKAEAMASAAGVRVGRALSISDQGDAGIYLEKRMSLDQAAPSEIPVGELDVVVRVQVQFAIE